MNDINDDNPRPLKRICVEKEQKVLHNINTTHENGLLPYDMIAKIASEVGCAADIWAMVFTCKSWFQAICANKKIIWKQLADRDFPGAQYYMEGIERLSRKMDEALQAIIRVRSLQHSGQIYFEAIDREECAVVHIERNYLFQSIGYTDSYTLRWNFYDIKIRGDIGVDENKVEGICYRYLYSMNPRIWMEIFTRNNNPNSLLVTYGYQVEWSTREDPLNKHMCRGYQNEHRLIHPSDDSDSE
jgi:hypothetical protein